MDVRRSGLLGTADTLGPWCVGGVYRPMCGMDTISTPGRDHHPIDTTGTRTPRPGHVPIPARDLLVGTVSALAALGLTAGTRACRGPPPAPEPIVLPPLRQWSTATTRPAPSWAGS